MDLLFHFFWSPFPRSLRIIYIVPTIVYAFLVVHWTWYQTSFNATVSLNSKYLFIIIAHSLIVWIAKRTVQSVFEDKNFSLVGESVMEWKFKTVFSVFLSFSDPLKLCFARSLRLSDFPSNSSVSLVTFHPSRKAIHAFVSFIFISTLWRTQHAHSVSFGSAKRGITPLLIALLFQYAFFLQLSFSFISIYWRSMLDFNNISLFDSRSIKWIQFNFIYLILYLLLFTHLLIFSLLIIWFRH